MIVMDRRGLLKTAGTASLAALVTSCGVGPMPLRAADSQPDGYPIVEALKFFAADLASRTNGRLKVEIYPSEQLGSRTIRWSWRSSAVWISSVSTWRRSTCWCPKPRSPPSPSCSARSPTCAAPGPDRGPLCRTRSVHFSGRNCTGYSMRMWAGKTS
ncbi:hypothetical protein GRI65_06525 [Altererythrobacter sediminis]|uniref:Uncharacterized protein n=1 Tax=Allopontixanthobacter sediminis TaxID=1689985 RepID=A0A845B1Q8_9SPHN|nr:hypothetical protein [Allopontixanthobacter sediminis]